MSTLGIGLSGLLVAEQALDITGTNLANSGTAGYHRQEAVIEPISAGGAASGGDGASVVQVKQTGDQLLENSILSQQPISGQVNQELTVLQNVENSIGALGAGSGVGDAIQGFFDSLQQLSSQPDSQPYLQQVATAGQTLSTQFNTLGQSLSDLSSNISQQASQQVDQLNQDASQIAQLNVQIAAMANSGQNANVLIDQRDNAISDLSNLGDVQVTSSTSAPNMVDVSMWGTSVVLGNQSIALQAGQTSSGQLGVSISGQNNYQTQITGGSLGALVGLKNQTLKGISDSLDTLAQQVIQQVNNCHVQGVGTDGSFTQLTGTQVGTGPISSWDPSVTAGQFYIRVTNTSTGQATRCAVAVDPAGTLSQIASEISAVQVNGAQPLTATAADSTLSIQAQSGYTFDFLPAPSSTPDSSTLTGTSQPTISGTYSGDSNQAYTVTVAGTGQVGVTPGLQLVVQNGAGQTVGTVDVGSDYAAGGTLQIDQGLTCSLSAGTLYAGQSFQVQALANSDPTGFLSAAGMNTFFQGDSATTMAVAPAIVSDPGRIAASLSSQGDNSNVLKMAALQTTALSGLDGNTPGDYFDQLATSVGQQVQACQNQQSTVNQVLQQLGDQESSVSGVDVNQEASNLMVYENMFESMAKYITTVDDTLQFLMNDLTT